MTPQKLELQLRRISSLYFKATIRNTKFITIRTENNFKVKMKQQLNQFHIVRKSLAFKKFDFKRRKTILFHP